jgi:hypothetical protein
MARAAALGHHVIVWKRAPATFALLGVFAVAAGLHLATADAHRAGDPPVLVPWSRIGDIALGEATTQVESIYGSEGYGYHVLSRDNGIVQGYYRLHDSRVFVTFEDGRVNEINFTTRYYRTDSRFGVGSTIPLGPCHKTATNVCEHRWHGFVWNAWVREKPCTCWVKVGLGAGSLPATTANFSRAWFFIYMRHGRVTSFHFALKFVD